MADTWIDELLGADEVHPEFEASLRTRVIAAAERRGRPRWLLPAAAAMVALVGVGTVVAVAARRDGRPSVLVDPTTAAPDLTSAVVSRPPTSSTPSPTSVAEGPVITAEPTTTTSTAPTTPSTAPMTVASSTATVPSPPRARIAGAIDMQALAVFGHSIAMGPEPIAADATIADISSDLGPPAVDTGWRQGWACSAQVESRLVRWGDLRLVFLRGESAEHLSSWRIGDPTGLSVDDAGPDVGALPPTGITTADGVGIGSAIADVDTLSGATSGSDLDLVDGTDVSVRFEDGRIVGIGTGVRVCEDGTGEDSTDPGVQLTIEYGQVFGMWAGMQQRPDSVVAHVSRTLGAPTADGGWQTFDICGGQADVRLVRWNDFQLVFARSADGEYLSSWRLGDPSGISIDPLGPELGPFPSSGVADSRGVGIGSPASVLDTLPAFAREADRVLFEGDGHTTIVNLRDGRIVGIGAGPLDCGGSHDQP